MIQSLPRVWKERSDAGHLVSLLVQTIAAHTDKAAGGILHSDGAIKEGNKLRTGRQSYSGKNKKKKEETAEKYTACISESL